MIPHLWHLFSPYLHCSAQPCGEKKKRRHNVGSVTQKSAFRMIDVWSGEKKHGVTYLIKAYGWHSVQTYLSRQSPAVPLGPTLPSHYAWLKWAASISRPEKKCDGESLSLLISSSLGKAPVPKCTDDWFLVRPNQLVVKESLARLANANFCILCACGELRGHIVLRSMLVIVSDTEYMWVLVSLAKLFQAAC